MKREELDKMEKSAIIDIVLRLDNEIQGRELMEKFYREERERLQKIVDAIQLVLNNVKK